MNQVRRAFLKTATALAAVPPSAKSQTIETNQSKTRTDVSKSVFTNIPSMVDADGRLQLDFGDEQMVLPGGLQPSMLCTTSGVLIVQAQMPEKPVQTSRMHYPSALGTVVSRDGGRTWSRIPLPPGENGVNLEGGIIQLRGGKILALDTYITPGAQPDVGIGQLYSSEDEWGTVHGPEDVVFELPGIDFYASSDDGGRPHAAARLHRRILELSNGHLLATFYGTMKGDKTPSAYRPTMMKMRVMLARSTDRGKRWKLISTVAVDPAVGTEGFDEPVIVRLSRGEHSGRLICFMRTGREIYETASDNEGASWSTPRSRVFGGLDIDRTELWVDMFRKVRGRTGRLLDESNRDELKGSVVDPDLIELRNGLLAAVFGVRIPQQLCWPNYQHPWNGNYLAFSLDGGATWPNVVRLTSGVPTTHYMALEQTPAENEIYVAYDYGFWNFPQRYIYGRRIKVTVRPI